MDTKLMTIAETSRYLSERLGVPVAVETLRTWRKTWPDGVRRGPEPRFPSPKALRYAACDCDAYVRERLVGVAPAMASMSR